MRIISVVLAAALLAGFTVQDAEKALDGEWAGMSAPTALAIDASKGLATLTLSGRQTTGPFKIMSVSAAAATVLLSDKRYVIHIRDNGKSLLFAAEGQASSQVLNRVR